MTPLRSSRMWTTPWSAQKWRLSIKSAENDDLYQYQQGYKAGGINAEAIAKANDEGLSQDADFFLNHRTFDPEYLWNAEFGVKGSSADKRLNLRITAFYMYRDNTQLKAWKTKDQQFAGYFDNGNSGENYGLEIEASMLFLSVTLTGSVGALDSEIDGLLLLRALIKVTAIKRKRPIISMH